MEKGSVVVNVTWLKDVHVQSEMSRTPNPEVVLYHSVCFYVKGFSKDTLPNQSTRPGHQEFELVRTLSESPEQFCVHDPRWSSKLKVWVHTPGSQT